VNPIKYLIPAVYQALTQGLTTSNGGGYVAAGYVSGGYVGSATPLLIEGLPVPVYQHLPPSDAGDRYVLLGQPTCEQEPGSQGCKSWDCTLLLDCITLYDPGYATSILADELADQLSARTDGLRLTLPAGLQAAPATVENIHGLQDTFDGRQTEVHRYMRLRYSLYTNL
jgi:hypothetical protein